MGLNSNVSVSFLVLLFIMRFGRWKAEVSGGFVGQWMNGCIRVMKHDKRIRLGY